MIHKVFFILAHGECVSPSKTFSTVPVGCKMIHTTKHGYHVYSDYVERMTRKFTTRVNVNAFLRNLPKSYIVRKYRERYVDTELSFVDKQYFMGVVRIPSRRFLPSGPGIYWGSENDKTPNLPDTLSGIMQKYGKGTYIFASCRGLRNVPYGRQEDGLRTKPLLTMAQKLQVKRLRAIEQTIAKKRSATVSPESKPKTKRVKLSASALLLKATKSKFLKTLKTLRNTKVLTQLFSRLKVSAGSPMNINKPRR